VNRYLNTPFLVAVVEDRMDDEWNYFRIVDHHQHLCKVKMMVCHSYYQGMEFGADYKWEEWQPLMVAQLLNCCDMIWYDWTCGDAVCLDSAVGVVSVAAAAEREQPDGFAAAVQCCRTKTTSLVDDVVESASESCFSGSIKAGNFGFKMVYSCTN